MKSDPRWSARHIPLEIRWSSPDHQLLHGQLRAFLTPLHPLKMTSLGAASRTFRSTTVATPRIPDPHRGFTKCHAKPPKHTTCYFKECCRSFYLPYYSRGSFILRLSGRQRSMRLSASPHFLRWRQRLPEKHLSRCHEKRLVRTRCVKSVKRLLRAWTRLCQSTSEPRPRIWSLVWSFTTMFVTRKEATKMYF